MSIPSRRPCTPFDLCSGKPKGHYPFPTAGALCNDIAVGPDGTACATDTTNMEVVRLKKGAKALQVWADNGAFGSRRGGLDGITILGNRVFAGTLFTGKLFSVPIRPDGSAGPVSEVKLDRPLERPDLSGLLPPVCRGTTLTSPLEAALSEKPGRGARSGPYLPAGTSP